MQRQNLNHYQTNTLICNKFMLLPTVIDCAYACVANESHRSSFAGLDHGPVPERGNNSIPGINVPYSRNTFIPGINCVRIADLSLE